MILQNSRTKSIIFSISFIVAVFVLFFISNLSYQQVRSLNDTEQLVTHTYKVQILLEQLFSLTKDAETGLRGFIVTRDSSFIEPYLNGHQKVDSIYNEIQLLTIDNDKQQQNLAKLKPIINRRFELLRSRLEDADKIGYSLDSDTFKVKMLKGKVVMDMIRQRINEMRNVETTLLAVRQKEHKSQQTITPFFSLLLMLFSLLIFIGAYYKINSAVKKLTSLNNELILTKESFEHAEKIANISHWEWNLETNKLTYSDNQYLLLGCQPGEFEPTLENYLTYVHPDDRDIILKGGDAVINQHQASDAIFRVIRKDGMLRYFKSTGKLIADDNGKKTVIGINYDITEQYLASKELENKNAELVRSNIELASFNHVASHDLQEPLRKIQVFISRIFETELSLSEKSQDYFKRMQASANRMQVLIDDLLAYSRVNGTDNIFEKVDLNTIIENVRNELIQSQAIEEKNAVINFDKLPEVHGIAFQLKQLFTNLIGNSLKYSSSARSPIINIHSDVVPGTEIPNSKLTADKKYYKITVADNGLGFEQQYAEKIFTLFQRLHDEQTFSGTGIGLAICKKVVENHSGFITANGSPNQGATFCIYLPVV